MSIFFCIFCLLTRFWPAADGCSGRNLHFVEVLQYFFAIFVHFCSCFIVPKAVYYNHQEEVLMMAIKESNGIHKGETIFCPVNGWDCPYFEDGVCYIADPMEECDDFASMFESWEEWEEL